MKQKFSKTEIRLSQRLPIMRASDRLKSSEIIKVKIGYIFALSITLLTAVQANAELLLKGDRGITLLAVNGKTDTHDAEQFVLNGISLPDGTNQILVSYTAEIKTSDDDYELEQSHTHVLLFSANDDTLSLSAPVIEKQSDFDQFNQHGNWTLRNKMQKNISFSHATLLKEGFQLSRDYETELREFNRSGHNAALPYAPPTDGYQTSSNIRTVSPAQPDTAESMLHYWYNQADEMTRARFRSWIDKESKN